MYRSIFLILLLTKRSSEFGPLEIGGNYYFFVVFCQYGSKNSPEIYSFEIQGRVTLVVYLKFASSHLFFLSFLLKSKQLLSIL